MEENRNAMSPDAVFLQEVYKGVCMGTDSINTILGKAKDKAMREELTKELDGYQDYANKARNKLSEMSVTAKEVGMLAKLPSEMSIAMNTLVDDSTSKLAELMIDGNTMGVIQMKKDLNRAKSEGVSQDAINLAEDVVAFQEKNIEKMKTFL